MFMYSDEQFCYELGAPNVVQVEVTGNCNIRCRHCYNGCFKKNNHYNNMDISCAKKVIKQCVKYGVYDIALTGGEPFLNYKVVKYLIKTAHDCNIRVSINSNLTLITNEIIDDLLDYEVRGILASIMSFNSETHDRIAQVAGAHARTVEGIKLCIKKGIPIATNTVVSTINFPEIVETFKFLHKLGVNEMCASSAECPSVGLDFSQLQLTRKQIITLCKDIIYSSKSLQKKISVSMPLPLCLVPEIGDDALFLAKKKCGAGVTMAVIDPTGNVRACPHLHENFGSIIDSELSDIWKKMNSWRCLSRVSLKCQSCKMLGHCFGGCRYRTLHNLNKEDPLMNFNAVDKYEEIFRKRSKDFTPAILTGKFIVKSHISREENGCYSILTNDGVFQIVDKKMHAFLNSLYVGMPYEAETFYSLGDEYKDMLNALFITGIIKSK